jgi:hypothetical protein
VIGTPDGSASASEVLPRGWRRCTDGPPALQLLRRVGFRGDRLVDGGLFVPHPQMLHLALQFNDFVSEVFTGSEEGADVVLKHLALRIEDCH